MVQIGTSGWAGDDMTLRAEGVTGRRDDAPRLWITSDATVVTVAVNGNLPLEIRARVAHTCTPQVVDNSCADPVGVRTEARRFALWAARTYP